MLLEHERNYGLGISILGQTWGRRAKPQINSRKTDTRFRLQAPPCPTILFLAIISTLMNSYHYNYVYSIHCILIVSYVSSYYYNFCYFHFNIFIILLLLLMLSSEVTASSQTASRQQRPLLSAPGWHLARSTFLESPRTQDLFLFV